MKAFKWISLLVLPVVLAMAFVYTNSKADPGEAMLVRIAEIEIHHDSLSPYKAILKEEAEASVKSEPGVISIFPMYQQNDSTQIRILEIYASKKAYESHLQSAHFIKYKETTSGMVKSLRLVEMNAIDRATMKQIFSKLKQ